MPRQNDTWEIKHMPSNNEARRKISSLAVLKGITIPEMLAELLKLAKL